MADPVQNVGLTIACEAYDRVAALSSGSVQIEGCSATIVALHAEELFLRTIAYQEFDGCELSLSSYILATSRGGFPYVAIPVFPSRAFRHSAIYLNEASGIRTPADLRGKRVGVPENQMTAALWARGMLSDCYGVRSQDISWRTGGLETKGRSEKIALELPDGFDVVPIGPTECLSELLLAGGLDAIVSARAPSCFGAQAAIRRLLPDYRTAEKDYFKATGLFPIMHVVVVRRSLIERHGWLATSLFKAFAKAKDACAGRLGEVGALSVMLPWLVAEYEDTVQTMGPDYWPYGIEANRKALEASVRYSHEQGLADRQLDIDALFAPGRWRAGAVFV